MQRFSRVMIGAGLLALHRPSEGLRERRGERFGARVYSRCVVLTISSIDCALGGGASGGVADYVLGRADRPAAFARGDYYVNDGDVDSDQPTMWHGAPAALAQLGLRAGTAVDRNDLVAALQGQYVKTGE